MTITRKTSFALGALLTLGVFILMGQTTPSSSASWGPPKKSIVNIFESQQVTIPTGGHLVVYQVPQDRWLTVTATSFGLAAGTQARWSELRGGVFEEKGFASSVHPHGSSSESHDLLVSPEPGGTAIGWVFRPGSQVVVQNLWGQTMPVPSYALIGYETRD